MPTDYSSVDLKFNFLDSLIFKGLHF